MGKLRVVVGVAVVVIFLGFFFGSAPFVQVLDKLTSPDLWGSGPEFKVENSDGGWDKQGVTIQSKNEYPVLVKEVVVNEKAECSEKPNRTLTLGDTHSVFLGFCVPIKVRIVTDHGDAVYNFN
jgi:hypothetical protein